MPRRVRLRQHMEVGQRGNVRTRAACGPTARCGAGWRRAGPARRRHHRRPRCARPGVRRQLGGGECRELDDVCAPHDRDAVVLGREQPRHRRRRDRSSSGISRSRSAPLRIGLPLRRRLRARVRCARRRALALGRNSAGELGNEVIDLRLSPPRAGTATDWVSVERGLVLLDRHPPVGKLAKLGTESDARAGPSRRHGPRCRSARWRRPARGLDPHAHGAREFRAGARGGRFGLR